MNSVMRHDLVLKTLCCHAQEQGDKENLVPSGSQLSRQAHSAPKIPLHQHGPTADSPGQSQGLAAGHSKRRENLSRTPGRTPAPKASRTDNPTLRQPSSPVPVVPQQVTSGIKPQHCLTLCRRLTNLHEL